VSRACIAAWGLLAVPLVAGCLPAEADDGLDALVLEDGTSLRGAVLGVEGGVYRVQIDDGSISSVPVEHVERLEPSRSVDPPADRRDDPTRVRVGFDLFLLGGGLRVEKPFGRANIRSYGFRGGVAGGLGGYQVTYGAVIGYGSFFVTFMPDRPWHVEASAGPAIGFHYGEPYPAWTGGFAFLGDLAPYTSLRLGMVGGAGIPGGSDASYVGWFWPELGLSATF
jgi:hypothetical protein